MVNDLYEVCDRLVLFARDEPLSEVALNSNVQHLLLIVCQIG